MKRRSRASRAAGFTDQVRHLAEARPEEEQSFAPAEEGLTDAVLQGAIDAHLAGRISEAQPVYERFIAAQHPNTVAYTNLAAIRLDQGLEEQAIRLWRQALTLRQDLPDAWFDLGNAMLRRQEPQEASAFYGQALALNPDHVGALINLSSIALQAGDGAQALAYAERALALQADSAEAACNVASALRQAKRLEEAEAMARHTLSLNPALLQATSLLAGILHDRGDVAAAETLLRQTIEQTPNPSSFHLALGNLLRLQNRLKEAIVHYRQAVDLDRSLVEAWSGLGQCHFELHDTTQSIEAYRRNEALAPQDAEVAYNLGVVLKHQGIWRPPLQPMPMRFGSRATTNWPCTA